MSGNDDQSHWTGVFNSPLESGLRCVCILTAAYPRTFDLQRVLQYDYLIVHSGDIKSVFPGAPDSIHPATPNRSSELAVRRELCQAGLRLMISRGLLACKFSKYGIQFLATEISLPFLDSLTEDYTNRLRAVASWLDDTFGEYPDESLSKLIEENLGRWGAEFLDQSMLLEEEA